jgi:DnaJ-class molecular chaperone
MNLNKACDLLELTKFELNDDSIKKAYRKKALQYHPDKCKPHLSTITQFSDIHDAYEYLMKTKK